MPYADPETRRAFLKDWANKRRNAGLCRTCNNPARIGPDGKPMSRCQTCQQRYKNGGK